MKLHASFAALLAAFLLFAARPPAASCADAMPDSFVHIEAVIPDALLDIRYFSEHNFLGVRVDGYLAPKCILTRQAAEALAKVQKDLAPFAMTLKIYDCYRPQQAVDHFVRWAKDIDDTKTKKEFYPMVDKRNLFRDGYIARRSGHSRGSTVDLTIVPLPAPIQPPYVAGEPLVECHLPAGVRFADNSLDMGTGFDCFNELSHPENKNLGPQHRSNRLLLKTLMEKHGFRNYDKEWWHFTLNHEPYPDTYFNFPVR
ncbi:MAG: M15 family metallopeptidase [Deltaproteobacteria bacterium]|nr:M15 family metallopeptidase [Deltaproteobacteria bacterium]